MKKSIYLIDDDIQLTSMMSEFFSLCGYSVSAETNSLNALDTFNKDPEQFDLVITDHTMPGISGLELSKKMLARRPDLPIFICTGFNEDIDEEKALDAGIKRFFFKPIELDTLVSRIQETCHMA